MTVKIPAMTRTTIVLVVLAVLLCVLASGCTSTAPVATPAPTTEATAVPTPVPTEAPVIATTVSAAPTTEPIVMMPTAQQVNLALTKDRPTSEIHLLYEGGPGDVFTQKIVMRVYTSATEYTEYVMNNGKKPIPGNEIVAPGTRGNDRCEVFVTSGGIRYKVMDEPAYAMA